MIGPRSRIAAVTVCLLAFLALPALAHAAGAKRVGVPKFDGAQEGLIRKQVMQVIKAHGYELDSGHVKDFLATVGVGLTSQYLEQAGRKLLGGLLGKMGGGLLGGLGKQAVSSGMSFASTYALGHVAKRYYAGGRTLSTQMLKEAFAGVAQEAQGLQTRYLPQIQEKARTLDAGKVLAMVRGA